MLLLELLILLQKIGITQNRINKMPYIKQEDRSFFDERLTFKSTVIHSAGDLNYCITKLVDHYITAHGKNYANINAAIGALECAKLELYRRIAAPYEDSKIQQNGDAYTL
jgi:hypothetical protein